MFRKKSGPTFWSCAALLAVVSCSKAHTRRGEGLREDLSIPEKVSVKAELLPPLSDAEYAESKQMLAAFIAANGIREHILISPSESDSSKEKRDDDFSRLSADEKAAIGAVLSKCRITDKPQNRPARRSLAGSEFHLHSTLHTTGRDCPADLSNEADLQWRVIARDEAAQNGTLSLNNRYHLHSEYKLPELARAAGLSFMDLDVYTRGRMEIAPDGSRGYERLRGTGRADLAGGPVFIYVKGESLEKDEERQELVLYVDLAAAEKVYHYAFHAKDKDGLTHIDDFYIGDRLLSKKEMSDLGTDEFASRLDD